MLFLFLLPFPPFTGAEERESATRKRTAKSRRQESERGSLSPAPEKAKREELGSKKLSLIPSSPLRKEKEGREGGSARGRAVRESGAKGRVG